MKKIIKIVVFALLAIAFVGTLVFLFNNSKPKVVSYNEFTVQKGDIYRTTVLTGTIIPRNEINIKPQINGIIEELYKEAGEYVEKGEIMAKLKVIPDMNALSSAQSRLRMAELNLLQAQTDFDRDKSLYEKKLISPEEYEKTLLTLNQSKEERTAAQETLEVIRDGVSKSNATESSTLIRSTVSGLILDVYVKEGNSVIQANNMNEGTTVATVANMNDLIFYGYVDETEVGSLSEGMSMRITIGALQNLTFQAELEFIAPRAVSINGSNQFVVKAAIKLDSQATIRSGYGANADVILQQSLQVLTVPESCVEFEGNQTFVHVKTDQGYEKREITLGLSNGLQVEVTQGVSEGDVIRGSQIMN